MIPKTITGDGSTTEFTVKHGIGAKLGGTDIGVVVYVYDKDNNEDVNLYHEQVDKNGNFSNDHVTFKFNTAPANGKEYKVLFFHPTDEDTITSGDSEDTYNHGFGQKPIVYHYRDTSPFDSMSIYHEHVDKNDNKSDKHVTAKFNTTAPDNIKTLLL